MANESLVPESLKSPLLDSAMASVQPQVRASGRTNLFSYLDNNQLDRDTDGLKTEAIGKQMGLPYDRDTVAELNVFGTVMGADELKQYEGGEALISLAKRKRQGRRGFTEALTTGSAADFLPYVGDIASTGIAIKNMKVVRDSLEKMKKEGVNALSMQEKVLTKLYIEDMQRQSEQSFGGIVGSIVRSAPAFAVEFFTTGGLFKAGTKLAGIAAKETAEEVVEKSMRKSMSEIVYRELKKPGMVKEALDVKNLNVEKVAEEIATREAQYSVGEFTKDQLKTKALKTAEAYVTAYKDPSKLRAVADFAVEYGKRGFFSHMDEVVRDLPPSVMGKLREAAGVAIVEAPIKGALYGAFDFAVVNPIAASVMGAEEAVTKTELGIYSTGRESLMRNAKMLALGTAVAEYASETSGRAFNALAGLVTENLAGNVGRTMARRGLRAVATSTDKEAGSVVQKLLEATYGTEAELKAARAGAQNSVLKRAFEAGELEKFGVKSVAEAQARPDIVDELMKRKLQFQEKSFLGYWIANKSLDMGITPKAVTKALESMGYDDIVGEFMEERYSDFAEALFGLDGSFEQKKGVAGRLAYAAKQSIPDIKQGGAELLAFALPVVGRATIAKAYGVLGAGDMGKAAEIGRIVDELRSVPGFTYEAAGEPVVTKDVKTSDADASVLAERVLRWGRANVSENNAWMRSRLTDLSNLLADVAPKVSTLREGKTGIVTSVAKSALKMMEFAITGNPAVAFHDPVKAMVGEKAGLAGAYMLDAVGTMYRTLYSNQLKAAASKSAGAVERRETPESLPESEMNDPAIMAAIRPQLVEGMESIAKIVLANHGNVITTEADVDRHLDTVFKDGVTEIDGMSREAFKKKFTGELQELAAGRMSMVVDGNRAAFFYKRPNPEGSTVGEVTKQLEMFLNKNNVISYIDGSTVEDVKKSLRSTARQYMDSSVMETAANMTGDADPVKVMAARFQLATTVFTGANMANGSAFERVLERAGEYARVFTTLHAGLLRKQFETSDSKVINISGSRNDYRLVYADEEGEPDGRAVEGTGTFKSLEEAYAEASKRGTARSAQIALTPGNAFFAEHASMLFDAPGGKEYMLADTTYRAKLEQNPFYAEQEKKSYKERVELLKADIQEARRYLDRTNRPFASEEEEAKAKETYERVLGEDGYETIAAKAAGAQGIRLMQKPDNSGVTGYMFSTSALNDNGVVLVPYRALGQTTALVEDSVEVAMKRSPWLFRDPTDPTKYRPAVKAFMRVVQDQLNAVREDPANSKAMRDKANYLTNMFNPDVYNFEALSHAIAAFPFAQGDAAISGTGTGGSAYYDVLGHIASRVRADRQEYNGFLGLVNRLSGGGLLTSKPESGESLRRIVTGVVPGKLLDDKNAVRTQVEGEVQYTFAGDVARAGSELEEAIDDAIKGMPRSGFVSKDPQEAKNEQARYVAELKKLRDDIRSSTGGGNVYLEEDLPYVLSTLVAGRSEQQKILTSDVVRDVEAEDPAVAAAELARMAATKNAREPESEVTASMSEDTLSTRPAVAIAIAEEWLKTKPVQSGDRRSKLEQIFDAWREHDPQLRPAVFNKFMKAVKATGLLVEETKEINSRRIKRAMDEQLSEDNDPRLDTEENDENETSGNTPEVDTEIEQIDENAGGDYIEGKAARDLELSPHSQIIRGMVHLHLPAAQRNDQTALEMLTMYSADLYGGDGMRDPRSYASLFNPAMWNGKNCSHPALVDEASFKKWLDQERPEDGNPLFDDLKITLRALGVEGAFKGLDKLKGSYGREILQARVEVDVAGEYHSVSFDPRRQSLSAEIAESLTRSAKLAGKGRAAKAVALLDAEMKAAGKNHIPVLAEAAEKVFGKNNWITQKLSDPRVQAMIAEKLSPASSESDRSRYNTWFMSWGNKSYGLFTLRLYRAASMAKEGKSAEEFVQEMLRGDARHLGNGFDRGGTLSFLNDAAGLDAVTSATRRDEFKTSKVKAIDQDKATGQSKFLMSKQFTEAYKAMNGGSEDGIERARRFAMWPDGTRVFATMAGVTRRVANPNGGHTTEQVGLASYDEVVDISMQDFESGKSPYVSVALYNSEKTLERLVRIPRKALPALVGKEKPTFAETLKLLSTLHGINLVSPKRVAYYTAGGASAILPTARVAIMVPADDPGANENYHGMGYITNADLGGYLRRQGFNSAAKVILTDDPESGSRTLFTKGQFILADQPVSEKNVSKAERDIRKLATEKKLDYVADMDSYKETFLYYKSTDKKTVMDLLAAGVTEADIVTPEGDTIKLSELVKETGLKLIQSSVNGAKVNVFAFNTGLRSQTVSAPPKKAEPKHNDVPINYMSDNPEMWGSLRGQDRVRLALAEREKNEDLQRIIDSLPESARVLIDAGCGLHSPVVARLIGPKLANALTSAFNHTMYGVQYLNRNFDGARVVEESPGVPKLDAAGNIVISDPYGGMDAWVHDAQELPPSQQERYGGAKRRLASTAANAGGMTFRYGLRVDHTAFGNGETDHAGLMQAVEDRVIQLKRVEVSGDLKAYLSLYKELIDGAFLDYKGDELMPGQLLSFADLVEIDEKGNATFDRTRLSVKTIDGKTFVALGGQIEISGRTPSRDGRRAEYAHSVAKPATLEEADGTRTYMRLVTKPEDGSVWAEEVPYPVGALIPGSDAILVMTPIAKYLAGSDEDWDKSHSQRMPTDRFGREKKIVVDAEKGVREAKSLDEARTIAKRATEGFEAAAFWAAVRVHRTYTPKKNPVNSTPFTSYYEKFMIPAVKRPPIDTPEGAGSVAASNKEVSQRLRGISVRIVGDCLTAANVGMWFTKPVAAGRSVLYKPAGANSPFWDTGFTVGKNGPMTEERLQTFIDFSTGIANSTFDDLKVALAYRAGFRSEHLDLYLFLGFESGVKTQAEYEQFHTAFMEWMNGPDGQAVSNGFRNGVYARKHGGRKMWRDLRSVDYMIKKEAFAEVAAAAKDGPRPKVYRMYSELSRAHKSMIQSIVLARGATPQAYVSVTGLVRALLFMQRMSAVGTVVTYKKANMAMVSQVEIAGRIAEEVGKILENQDAYGIQFSAQGLTDVKESLELYKKKAEKAKEALAGDVKLSPLYLYASRMKLEGGWTRDMSARADGLTQADAVERALNTLVPFEAAVALTPSSTKAKIMKAIETRPAMNPTEAAMTFIETVFNALYQKYSQSGRVNAAMDLLLSPSKDNGANRLTVTGSDNTMLSEGALQAAMESMRDDKSGIGNVDVFVTAGTTINVSASDFYWMLMQYTLLTSGLAIETTRGNQALMRAFFGPEMFRAASDYQTAAITEVGAEPAPGRLLRFVSVTGDQGRRKFPLSGIPDGYSVVDMSAPAAVPAPAPVVKAAKPAQRPLPPERAPLALAAADTPAQRMTEIPASYKGIGVIKGETLTHPIHGGRPAVSTRERPDGTKVIVVDEKEANRQFNDKRWAKPRLGGITPLPIDAFASAIEFIEFALEHEYQHTLFPSVKREDGLAEYSANEEKINRAAAAALGRSAELYPGSVEAPVAQTPASVASVNLHAQARAIASHEVIQEMRRLPDYLVYGLEESRRMGDREAAAARVMAKTLARVSDTAWGAGIPGAKDIASSAAIILDAMRYAEPSVFIGALRAMRRRAQAAGNQDAMDEIVGILNDAKATGMKNQDRIIAIRNSGAFDADHPALQVMQYALASEARVDTGETKADIEAVARKILSGLEIEMPERVEASAAKVNIWFSSGENAQLSNLALRPFEFNTVKFLSVEHAYQTLKAGHDKFDQATYDAYLKYPKAGVKIRGKFSAKTEGGYNIRLMESLMRESFLANKAAREALMDTGDAVITHTQDTGIWKTEFPRILTAIRDDLLVEYRPTVLEAGITASLEELKPVPPIPTEEEIRDIGIKINNAKAKHAAALKRIDDQEREIDRLRKMGTWQADGSADSMAEQRAEEIKNAAELWERVKEMSARAKAMRDRLSAYREAVAFAVNIPNYFPPELTQEQANAAVVPLQNGAQHALNDAAVGAYEQMELGITASRAEDFADLMKQAQAEVDKYMDDGEFMGYVKKNYVKKFRKTIVSQESVALRAPLFMANDPFARRNIGAFIKDAADRIMANGNLGTARIELVSALNYFFKEAKAQGGLIDVAAMNPKRYGEFMSGIGMRQTGAIRALTELRDTMAEASPEDRAALVAAIEEADRLFFSALHLGRSAASALRPTIRVSQANGELITIKNPLRAEIRAVEAGNVQPPAGAEPVPPVSPEEISGIDPDTGHPGFEDDFGVTFIDTDAWYYGTVFPSFRGGDIRDILLDKTLIAVTPEAFSIANRFEAYLGIDSEGSLRKITHQKGMPHYLSEGGWVYDDEKAADVMHFGRRKIVRELADITAGNAFSDEELEMARWYGNACYFAIGNGLNGRQQTAVDIRFDLPWGIETAKLLNLVSVEEAERRRGNPTERPYAIHEALLRLKEVLPAPFLEHAVAALRSAVEAGSTAKGDKDAKSQAALKALHDSGFAEARRRREKDASGRYSATEELFDVKFAIPVRLSEKLFLDSTAATKLEKNGRDRANMTLEEAVKPIRETFERLQRTVKSMGWAVNGDAKLFSDVGTAAPFFKGIGAFRHYSRRLEKPQTPEYKDAVQKAYDSLADSFKYMRRQTRAGVAWTTGAEAAEKPGFQRMFNFLKDLAPNVFDKADTAADVWSVIARGQVKSLGLDETSRAWDIATKIYELSVARLHESAWAGGTVSPVGPEAVGLEAFAQLVGESAQEFDETAGTPGVSFSEIYDTTGAMALGLTAGEALAAHAKQIAEMTRYRACVNRMLMTQGEDGRPLVYARPSMNPNDDTVPDRIWGMIARWWVETYAGPAAKGAYYDESKTGRENAMRLYDEITPLLKGAGAVQDDSHGVARYQLTDVEIPAGMGSFSGVCAMKDPAGDDTKARLNVFGGGEAANIVRQVFALAGYGRPDTRLVGMNRFLSWSKSASVMASFFFPIATAFESPIAAVGTWPTLFGLTKQGADMARWLEENQNWIAKKMGVADIAQAPFMADIMRVIGSDDPALVDLKTQAILSGLNLADRAHNMMDTDRTIIAKDIDKVVGLVRKQAGGKMAKAMRAILEGAMEHSSEVAFEYVINATKMAVFAQMNNRLRTRAIAAGRWWDPVRDMKKWANYINAEVGGIDTAMYPWMTPKMQQFLKAIMFSWEWTLGAWEAGGGNVLTQKWFGRTTPGNIRGFMFGRWARMYGSVMIGLPFFMQLAINATAKAFGDDDPDDKWFTQNNEIGHGWKDFDITPLLRRIANMHVIPFVAATPTWGEVKKRAPERVLGLPFGSLIPALTGQEGEEATTRQRRYYMHLGKQGWEIAGWFENPSKSFLSKMSMPAQRILEGVLGITPSMGWEKPFAEMGFWERWTSLDSEKSALLNLTGAVMPFSVMSLERAPEAGAISLLGPVGKGISKTRAINDMAAEFSRWADADSYVAQRQGVKGAWTDLQAMGVEWIDALRLNGYDPKESLKEAITKARRPLYEKIHKALPVFPSDKADTKALEEAARGLYRLNYVAKDLMKSIKGRDKAQHIKRTGDLSKITNEAMRDAFANPYGAAGTTRDAALGGDVRGLLATDEVPKTIFGYPIVPQEQMTEQQKKYFVDNPQAAGHYEMSAKKGAI